MSELIQRKHSAPYLMKRILREVWNHPNNRDARLRAAGRSLVWQLRKRVAKTPRVRPVYDTMKIWMDPRFGSVSNIVYFGDDFDRDEMSLMRRYLRPGDRFVDVGANIGTYTLLAASLVGEGGRVDAFEAVPVLCEGLRRNVALNGLDGSVHVHELAVSDTDGAVRFKVGADVSSRIAIDADEGPGIAVVACGRLDRHLPDRGIAMVKIDVEGAEPAVLRGFVDHLSVGDPPVIMVEVLANQLARQGHRAADIFGLLEDAGYDLATFSHDRGGFTWLDGEQVSGNLIAVSRRSRGEVMRRIGDGARQGAGHAAADPQGLRPGRKASRHR